MTVEIRQLVIRAVVSSKAQAAKPIDQSEIVDQCVRAVLRQLERTKER